MVLLITKLIWNQFRSYRHRPQMGHDFERVCNPRKDGTLPPVFRRQPPVFTAPFYSPIPSSFIGLPLNTSAPQHSSNLSIQYFSMPMANHSQPKISASLSLEP